MVGSIWRRSSSHLPGRIATGLLNTYILSSSLYGCHVTKENPRILRAVTHYARVILQAAPSCRIESMMEFLGWWRPKTRTRYLRLRFVINLWRSPMDLVHNAMTRQIENSLPWIIETRAIAATFNFSTQFTHIIDSYQPKNTMSSSAQQNRQETEDMDNEQLLVSVNEFEKTHWCRALSRIPSSLINTPLSGSYILNEAKVPGALALYQLRYDINAHYRRNPRLHKLDHLCTCCTAQTPESNVHILFDCTLDSVPATERTALKKAIHTLRKHRPHAIHAPDTHDAYLYWLTGPNPRRYKTHARAQSRGLRQKEIDAIAQAADKLRRIRISMFQRLHDSRQYVVPQAHTPPRMPRAVDDRTTVAQRILQCRDQDELDAVCAWSNVALVSFQGPVWRTFFTSISFERFSTVIRKLQWVLPYLLNETAEHRHSCATRLRPNFQPPSITHGAQDIRKLIKRMINNYIDVLPWFKQLPFEYLSSGPLAEAWLAADSKSDRGLLLPQGQLPDYIIRANKPHPSLKNVLTSIASALRYGELQYENLEGYDSNYPNLSSNRKWKLKLEILKHGKELLQRGNGDGAFYICHGETKYSPRSSVWGSLTQVIAGALTHDEAIHEWTNSILNTVREVDRASRPTTRFEGSPLPFA